MAPNAEALIEFQAAIELKHLCKSNHRETVFVHEKMKRTKRYGAAMLKCSI